MSGGLTVEEGALLDAELPETGGEAKDSEAGDVLGGVCVGHGGGEGTAAASGGGEGKMFVALRDRLFVIHILALASTVALFTT